MPLIKSAADEAEKVLEDIRAQLEAAPELEEVAKGAISLLETCLGDGVEKPNSGNTGLDWRARRSKPLGPKVQGALNNLLQVRHSPIPVARQGCLTARLSQRKRACVQSLQKHTNVPGNEGLRLKLRPLRQILSAVNSWRTLVLPARGNQLMAGHGHAMVKSLYKAATDQSCIIRKCRKGGTTWSGRAAAADKNVWPTTFSVACMLHLCCFCSRDQGSHLVCRSIGTASWTRRTASLPPSGWWKRARCHTTCPGPKLPTRGLRCRPYHYHQSRFILFVLACLVEAALPAGCVGQGGGGRAWGPAEISVHRRWVCWHTRLPGHADGAACRGDRSI